MLLALIICVGTLTSVLERSRHRLTPLDTCIDVRQHRYTSN